MASIDDNNVHREWPPILAHGQKAAMLGAARFFEYAGFDRDPGGPQLAYSRA